MANISFQLADALPVTGAYGKRYRGKWGQHVHVLIERIQKQDFQLDTEAIRNSKYNPCVIHHYTTTTEDPEFLYAYLQ